MRRALSAVVLAGAACGSEIRYLDPGTGGDARPWVNATGNLAGVESECGNLSYLSARPDADELIAGVALNGLWVNTATSTSWSRLGQASGSEPVVNRTSSIVYDPEHPGTFYESGSHNSAGVYRTVDDGRTLLRLGSVTNSDGVAIDFTDPLRRTMLATGHEQTGAAYRSADNGASWTDIGAHLPAGSGFPSGPLVLDVQTHLVGTTSGSTPGVFRTIDGGQTFTQVYAGGVVRAPLVASDKTVYWLLDDHSGVIRSEDGGATWRKLPAALGDNLAGSIVELSRGRLVAVGSNRLVRSDDRGVTWNAIGAQLPFTPWGFVYSHFRKAFYAWQATCAPGSVPVPSDAIARLDYDEALP